MFMLRCFQSSSLKICCMCIMDFSFKLQILKALLKLKMFSFPTMFRQTIHFSILLKFKYRLSISNLYLKQFMILNEKFGNIVPR